VATLRARRLSASDDADDISRAAAGIVAAKCDDKRVVCIGESSHGTHEFYAARCEVSVALWTRRRTPRNR
jgi:erythromycin esterase-like protein